MPDSLSYFWNPMKFLHAIQRRVHNVNRIIWYMFAIGILSLLIFLLMSHPSSKHLFNYHVDRLNNPASSVLITKTGADKVLNSKFKHILQWTTFWGSYLPQGRQYFDDNCPNEKRCSITTERRLQLGCEAVVFFITDTRAVPSQHPRDQHWVFISHENPLGKSVFRYRSPNRYRNVFNLSSTYMSSSDFPYPYVTCKKQAATDKADDLWKHKSELPAKVLWFMSSICKGTERVDYYNKLKKYLQVDLFGRCGQVDTCKSLKGAQRTACLKDKYYSKYKYYLAFENGRCREYITEKVLTALNGGMVPIVMGASFAEYSRVLPPDSFLHVDNFTSVEHLANYIQTLEKNPRIYNRYHAWRANWSCESMKSWPQGPWLCDLCDFLWDPSRSNKTHTVDLNAVFSPKFCSSKR